MKAYRLRTASIFVILTLFMVALGYVIGWFFGYGYLGFALMFVLSVFMSFFSYFFSKQSALRANRVHLVTREEEPRLYRIVEKVAADAGLPMPEVGVSEIPMPNAFATGRNPQNAAVVATRGILNLLNDGELEGVIGHEMAHVKNRDILIMSVASFMVSVMTFAARMFFYGTIFGGGRDRENNALMLAVAVLSVILVPIAGMMLQLAVSRNREYLADETGARITGRPRELANALRKLEDGCIRNPNNNYSDTAHANMWISNPCRKGFMLNLFRTHPTTDERVRRLEVLAGAMDSGKVPVYTPGEDSSTTKLSYQ